MYSSTKIKLKRTKELLKKNASQSELKDIQEQPIDFGEPIFVDNNTVWGSGSNTPCNSYIAIGSPVTNGKVKHSAIFKGFWDKNKSDSLVFFTVDGNGNKKGLVDESNNPVYADRLTASFVSTYDSSDKYYILCQPEVNRSNNKHGKINKFKMGDAGIYVTSKGIMHCAAWNDYAEKRKVLEEVEPGDVVCENGDGTLSLSTEKLQACPYVVTDTFGFVIGDDADTPLAVAGRALVKIENSDNASVGDCVCAGIDGKAVVMSRKEISEYPDRILGIITEIPSYDSWNGIDVNNRIWIKIK